MISLLQLQYFCELANELHLTRTAEKLYVSQSTLSIAISKMEQELGVDLFDRKKNRLVLNEYGKKYYQYISPALKQIDDAKSQIQRMKEKNQDRISFAASHSAIWHNIIMDFLTQYPSANVQVKSENLETYHQRLLDSSLDFVITGSEDLDYRDLDSCPLTELKLCLCTSAEHPLASRASVRLKEIERYPYIALSEELSFRKFCDRTFERFDIHVNRVYECGSETRPALIRENRGICLTVDAEESKRLYAGCCFIPIKDEGLVRQLSLYWKRDKVMSDTMEAFRSYIRRR